MLAIDGVSYDWSFMADEAEALSEAGLVATKFALMAFSDSEVNTIESCSKSCKALKECEKLREHYDNLRT